MRLARLLILAVLTLGCVGTAHAQAQDGTIRLATNREGTACELNPSVNASMTLYALFVPSGVTGGGITGAEFRIEGLPAGWVAIISPNPTANLVLGNPLGAGANIAFPSCQSGPAPILLYTIEIIPTTPDPVMLTVREHTTPSNPAFSCPLVTLCDAPVFTKVCVCGGAASSVSADCGCPDLPTPSMRGTWGSLKTLYR